MNRITINCFNCRGLRNDQKRQNIFSWLNTSHPGVTFLQETHSTLSDEKKWAREWGGDIYYTHGEFNARGVAILIPKSILDKFKYINGYKDNNGRFILMNCEIESKEFTFINIYCPTKDNHSAQIDFLEVIRTKLEEHGDKNIIMGGDLNTYLNIKMDKKGGKIESSSKYSENLKTICEEFSLIDIWRIRNPDTLRFTRRENSRLGIVQSRLDYFLITEGISYLIKNTTINIGLSSDHSLIRIELELNATGKRGRGLWKFNNDLLTDQNYVKLIKTTIKNITNDIQMENKNQLWEYTKCQIRTDTMVYSSKRSKEMRQKENILVKKLEAIEKTLDKNIVSESPEYYEYIQTKGEWENIVKKRTNGILLRSKAQWIEEGEKNTKYFVNLEKRNYEKKHIKKLIDEKGTEIIEEEKIIKEQQNFYENLYTTKVGNKNIEFGNPKNNIPQLDQKLKDICDSPLTIEECGAALKKLQNNKSPGADGFTTNFFKFFWIDLKDILFTSYLYTEKNGVLSTFQKLGILNLAPKEGKDLRYLKNWRPITLLTTDYKILTKALAMRLQKSLPSLINPDQVGYISGRYIGQNIRTIFDIMTYTDEFDLEAYITQVDFEKAFDSIEWPFLFHTLELFGFGKNFINWIKILHTDIQACVGNNGFFSPYFRLTRSIRQGCPISALLFLLVAEVLAIQIRENKNIKGIQINEIEQKIGLMADDTTLFLADLHSLSIAISTFKNFEKYSGLKLNLNKTEIIPIGKSKRNQTILPLDLTDIKVVEGPFKALGIWYSYDKNEIQDLNLENRLKNMNIIINIWKSRSLSLKGKITIIKTLILPQINFLFSMIHIPDQILKKIDKILFDYLWNSKPAKIKRSTIIAPIGEGGMGMVDVYNIHHCSKISWIRRLFNPGNEKWKTIMLQNMKTNLYQLNKKYKYKTDNQISEFYQQVLSAWKELFNTNAFDRKEIINEYILFNENIKIANKVIDEKYINNDKMLNLKILDILDVNLNFKTILELNTEMDIKISQMKYNSIRSAIPINWKKTIKDISIMHVADIRLNDEPQIKINNILKPLSKCTNKNIYHKLLCNQIKPPTAVDKWINTYPFLEKEDWSPIFKRTFEVTKEPYLQSFQYKILNRILNTNENLFKWKIHNSNECRLCGEIDGVEHHLFYCKDSKLFWKRLKEWMIDNLGYGFELTVCEIIFGIPNTNNPDIKLVNFLTLLGKWYINKCKTTEKQIYFFEFLTILKNKVSIMTYIPMEEELGLAPWLEMLHSAL